MTKVFFLANVERSDSREFEAGGLGPEGRSAVPHCGPSVFRFSGRVTHGLSFVHKVCAPGPIATCQQTERTYILQVVLENTKVPQQQVQVAAFECLVKIAEEYYTLLEPYMSGIGPISWDALKSGDDSVCIAAMEFWNTIADVEIDIQQQQADSGLSEGEQADEAALAGIPKNSHIIKQALPFLLPILLNALTDQESEEVDAADSWTSAMAAGTCLGLCAQVKTERTFLLSSSKA